MGLLGGVRRRAAGRLRHWSRVLELRRRGRLPPIRIVVGSGGIPAPGWLATERDELDLLDERDWERYFAPGTLDAILAEHVWEHLSEEGARKAARTCFRYLRPGGYLRVAVPDGWQPSAGYVAAVRPGGTGPGADDHKVLYTIASLTRVLSSAGFDVRPLEYFDATGAFVRSAWRSEDGHVRRAAGTDERNRDGTLRYTSIVVDAFRPAGT